VINFLKDIVANKTRIIAVISLILLIGQSHGLDLTKYIGADWQTTLTNIFALITLIAIGDNGGANNEQVQPIQENTEKTEDVPALTDNTQVEKPYYDARMEQLKSLIDQANIILKE
jgi:uncharacterized membrane protein